MTILNGVILQKLQTFEQTLAELRSLGSVSTAQLAGDWRTRRAIERDLQVLVEIVIGIINLKSLVIKKSDLLCTQPTHSPICKNS